MAQHPPKKKPSKKAPAKKAPAKKAPAKKAPAKKAPAKKMLSKTGSGSGKKASAKKVETRPSALARRGGNHSKRNQTRAKAAAFIKILAVYANVTRSCKAVQLDRMWAYNLRDRDEEFRVAWDRAMETGTEALIDEATRRAAEGTVEKVWGKDIEGNNIVLEERLKYSDTLLIFLLKGRRPDLFKERANVRHHGDIDLHVGVNQSVLDLISLTMNGINSGTGDIIDLSPTAPPARTDIVAR